MLKYLIVQLDDISVSFCHYNNDKNAKNLIELETLKKSLSWSMKENLSVQFLYPDYQLPDNYKNVIADIYHVDIVSSICEDKELLHDAEIVIFNSWADINHFSFAKDQTYVVRTTFEDLFANGEMLGIAISKVSRLNVVITDIENLNPEIEQTYTQFLDNLNKKIYQEYMNNHSIQVNILTDRMMLDSMNNCGAGEETITLAPNGKFYICPGFYLDGSTEVGEIDKGLNITNPQLYELDHAPICRICDAWHCKRCIWQNKKFTLEVNTPSHEQCVISHIERNSARNLLASIRESSIFLPGKEIPEISYLDPFDEVIKPH